MAAVAAAMLKASQLYESLTLTSPSMICGCATKKPNRSPAKLYDLLSERETRIFSLRLTSARQLVSAKSTYASSTSNGQASRSASSSTRSGAIIVPDGLLG